MPLGKKDSSAEEKPSEQVSAPQSSRQPASKTKIGLFLVVFLLIVAVIIAGILGFLYYQSNSQNKKLVEELAQLQTTPAEPTPSPLPTQTPETETEEESDLSAKVELYEKKLNEALTYSSVFGYLNSLITKHNGLDGWTDQEYAEGRALAAKTGDSAFLDTLDWAWQNEQISQEIRLFSVLVEIQDGIHQALRGALYP